MNSASQRARLLLAEEDPLLARALARELGRWFAVDIAGKAEDLLHKLQLRLPSVVVVDVYLDGARGTRVMAQIASQWSQLPRFLMSWWPAADAGLIPNRLADGMLPKYDVPAMARVIAARLKHG